MDATGSQEDNDSQQNNNDTNCNVQIGTIISNSTTTSNNTISGYYDAEKCRAHIANQMRVSKIDRFAAQVYKALEVEADVNFRLANILNMFLKRSAQVAHEFALKCKLGLRNHRQDRILNHSKTNKNYNKTAGKNNKLTKQTTFSKTRTRIINVTDRQYTISNDLLYGEGAQLIQELLGQSTSIISKEYNLCPPSKRQATIKEEMDDEFKTTQPSNESDLMNLNDISDTFDPAFFVKKLEGCIRVSLQSSNTITIRLTTIRQIFEKLASEHRAKVDLVYAAEEERQSSTVIRRSAYNLSVAAIKATSTPIHVNSNVD